MKRLWKGFVKQQVYANPHLSAPYRKKTKLLETSVPSLSSAASHESCSLELNTDIVSIPIVYYILCNIFICLLDLKACKP